jgi:hypothetical protein
MANVVTKHSISSARDHPPMANYLVKLFAPPTVRGEFYVPADDDLSAIRRLRDTYPDLLSGCDCAELYGPDGKLVWEQRRDGEA